MVRLSLLVMTQHVHRERHANIKRTRAIRRPVQIEQDKRWIQ